MVDIPPSLWYPLIIDNPYGANTMAHYSIDTLILAAAHRDLGWAVADQLESIANECTPEVLSQQNPNAVRQIVDWLNGIATGVEEVDEWAGDLVENIKNAQDRSRIEE